MIQALPKRMFICEDKNVRLYKQSITSSEKHSELLFHLCACAQARPFSKKILLSSSFQRNHPEPIL